MMETMGPITCSIRGRAFDLSLFDGQRNQGKLFDLIDIVSRVSFIDNLLLTTCSCACQAEFQEALNVSWS